MLMLLFLEFPAAPEDAAVDAVAATATAVIVKQNEQIEVFFTLIGMCVVALS
jgi:hypothetical protein